eukprot:GDKK01023935.1.p1 GENE.GDKK01023935.1~~GDKK01023935.1.p1  ORF type:complete len:316 (-),score=57.99 GDKK01023935.1:336-1283(-)
MRFFGLLSSLYVASALQSSEPQGVLDNSVLVDGPAVSFTETGTGTGDCPTTKDITTPEDVKTYQKTCSISVHMSVENRKAALLNSANCQANSAFAIEQEYRTSPSEKISTVRQPYHFPETLGDIEIVGFHGTCHPFLKCKAIGKQSDACPYPEPFFVVGLDNKQMQLGSGLYLGTNLEKPFIFANDNGSREGCMILLLGIEKSAECSPMIKTPFSLFNMPKSGCGDCKSCVKPKKKIFSSAPFLSWKDEFKIANGQMVYIVGYHLFSGSKEYPVLSKLHLTRFGKESGSSDTRCPAVKPVRSVSRSSKPSKLSKK